MCFQSEFIVYSNHCPRCNILISLLNDKGIEYTLIEDLEEILAKAEEARIQTIPFAKLPGNVTLSNFKETVEYINSL